MVSRCNQALCIPPVQNTFLLKSKSCVSWQLLLASFNACRSPVVMTVAVVMIVAVLLMVVVVVVMMLLVVVVVVVIMVLVGYLWCHSGIDSLC